MGATAAAYCQARALRVGGGAAKTRHLRACAGLMPGEAQPWCDTWQAAAATGLAHLRCRHLESLACLCHRLGPARRSVCMPGPVFHPCQAGTTTRRRGWRKSCGTAWCEAGQRPRAPPLDARRRARTACARPRVTCSHLVPCNVGPPARYAQAQDCSTRASRGRRQGQCDATCPGGAARMRKSQRLSPR